MSEVILIDGHPLMWRAAFSGGVSFVCEGIIRLVSHICDKFNTGKVLVFWDSGKSRWRHYLYPEYKANRDIRKEEIDLDEMMRQKDSAQAFLKILGFRNIWANGVEADDLLSVFSEYFSGLGHSVIIATRDRDLWQLVSDRVSVFDPLSDTLVTAAEVEAEFGCVAKQVPVWKALRGDPGDGIGGVKRVGEKGATTLLQGNPTFEEMLDRCSEGGKRLHSHVLAGLEDLEESYRLVVLPRLCDFRYILTEEQRGELVSCLTGKVFVDALQIQVFKETVLSSNVSLKLGESVDCSGLLGYLRVEGRMLDSFEALDQAIVGCRKCALRNDCGEHFPTLPAGSGDAQIMLLGRNPGRDELVNGVPFVGRAGMRLNKFLEFTELHREQCWITNVCKCYSAGNRPITYGEMEACKEYLQAEISLVKPKMIIAFGTEAMGMVSPYTSQVSKHAGELLHGSKGLVGDLDCIVALMPHPSYAIRSLKGEEDFQYGAEQIKKFLDSKRGG